MENSDVTVEIIRLARQLRPSERTFDAEQAQQIVRRALKGERYKPQLGILIETLRIANTIGVRLNFPWVDDFISGHRKENANWIKGMMHNFTSQFYLRVLNIKPLTVPQLIDWRKEANQWLQGIFNCQMFLLWLKGQEPFLDVLEPTLQQLQMDNIVSKVKLNPCVVT